MTSKIKASTNKVIKSSTWLFSGHHYDLVNCCHRWPQICFICRSHSHILLFSFMIYHWISSMSNTTGATSVEGLANPVHLRSFHVLVAFVLLNLQISWTIVCIFVFLLLVIALSVHRPFAAFLTYDVIAHYSLWINLSVAFLAIMRVGIGRGLTSGKA